MGQSSSLLAKWLDCDLVYEDETEQYSPTQRLLSFRNSFQEALNPPHRKPLPNINNLNRVKMMHEVGISIIGLNEDEQSFGQIEKQISNEIDYKLFQKENQGDEELLNKQSNQKKSSQLDISSAQNSSQLANSSDLQILHQDNSSPLGSNDSKCNDSNNKPPDIGSIPNSRKNSSSQLVSSQNQNVIQLQPQQLDNVQLFIKNPEYSGSIPENSSQNNPQNKQTSEEYVKNAVEEVSSQQHSDKVNSKQTSDPIQATAAINLGLLQNNDNIISVTANDEQKSPIQSIKTQQQQELIKLNTSQNIKLDSDKQISLLSQQNILPSQFLLQQQESSIKVQEQQKTEEIQQSQKQAPQQLPNQFTPKNQLSLQDLVLNETQNKNEKSQDKLKNKDKKNKNIEVTQIADNKHNQEDKEKISSSDLEKFDLENVIFDVLNGNNGNEAENPKKKKIVKGQKKKMKPVQIITDDDNDKDEDQVIPIKQIQSSDLKTKEQNSTTTERKREQYDIEEIELASINQQLEKGVEQKDGLTDSELQQRNMFSNPEIVPLQMQLQDQQKKQEGVTQQQWQQQKPQETLQQKQQKQNLSIQNFIENKEKTLIKEDEKEANVDMYEILQLNNVIGEEILPDNQKQMKKKKKPKKKKKKASAVLTTVNNVNAEKQADTETQVINL